MKTMGFIVVCWGFLVVLVSSINMVLDWWWTVKMDRSLKRCRLLPALMDSDTIWRMK